MVIPAYTPNYPPDGYSLGQTKQVIRDNLDGTFQTLNVDHINNNGSPGSQPAGYHTVIHEVPQTSVNTVTGYNQVFSGVPGTLIVNSATTPAIPPGGDQQLYSLTGGGILSQLTGRVASANGYVWVGGILLQWGTVASPGSTGTVTFATANVAFPNNCYGVFLTVTSSPTNVAPVASLSSSVSSTAFSYRIFGQTVNTMYWVAIGN